MLGEGAVDLVGDKTKREKKAEHGLDLENSELFFVFKIFSRHDAKVRKKLMCRRCFTCIVMLATVTNELAEAAYMSAVRYGEIEEEYCGTVTTYVIAQYENDAEKQWYVGKGVCFSLKSRILFQ